MPKGRRRNGRPSIRAPSAAPVAFDWLRTSDHPRVLHVFERACNLINERREILSIVTPEIGDGPFHLVVEDRVNFADHINLQSPVDNIASRLVLGDLTIHIHTADARLWSPRPDWEILHDKRTDILDQLTSLPIYDDQARGFDLFSGMIENRKSPISDFSTAITTANIHRAIQLTSRLAGLGLGLTPAGDDFILGALLGAWIVHPPGIAKELAEAVANAAAPLTTSLSAAWLRAVGKGEAGAAWHRFFEALVSGTSRQIRDTVNPILATGATSGADALAGFMGVFRSWQGSTRHEIPDCIRAL